MPRSKTLSRLDKMLKRVPRWLTLDYSRIEGLDDLAFHIEHEIDLYEDLDHHATIKTQAQAHRAKMLLAEVRIQEQDEILDTPCPACGVKSEAL